jgi:molybdenum cofactor cytidylyltransferase
VEDKSVVFSKKLTMHITGILLAAGNSLRFGSNKLLHPLPDGIPIAVAAARVLNKTVNQTLAVVRSDSRALAKLLRDEGLDLVTCPQAAVGMGTSIACGIRASSQAHAWVIALADMPFIQAATIHQLVTLLRQGATIVVPQYRGRRGHPVGFQRQFGTQLSALTGDTGARALLQQYQSQITLFSCEDAGIHWDIDTPSQLNNEVSNNV